MRRVERSGGFTIIELSIALAAFVFLLGMVGVMSHRARADQLRSEGYASDLRELRSALAQIEADLKVARGVVPSDGAFELEMEGDEVLYRIESCGLVRIQGEWRRSWRVVAVLDLQPEGDLVRLALTLRSRAVPAPAEPLQIHTAFRLRSEVR